VPLKPQLVASTLSVKFASMVKFGLLAAANVCNEASIMAVVEDAVISKKFLLSIK